MLAIANFNFTIKNSYFMATVRKWTSTLNCIESRYLSKDLPRLKRFLWHAVESG